MDRRLEDKSCQWIDADCLQDKKIVHWTRQEKSFSPQILVCLIFPRSRHPWTMADTFHLEKIMKLKKNDDGERL